MKKYSVLIKISIIFAGVASYLPLSLADDLIQNEIDTRLLTQTPYLLPQSVSYFTDPWLARPTKIQFGGQTSNVADKSGSYPYSVFFKINFNAGDANSFFKIYRDEDQIYRTSYSPSSIVSSHNGALTKGTATNVRQKGDGTIRALIPVFTAYNQEYLINKGGISVGNLEYPIVKISILYGGDHCYVGYPVGKIGSTWNAEWSQMLGASFFSSDKQYSPYSRGMDSPTFPSGTPLLSYTSFGTNFTYQSKVAMGIFSFSSLGIPVVTARPRFAVQPISRIGQIRLVNLTSTKRISRLVDNIENGTLKSTAYNLVEPDWINDDMVDQRIDLYYVSPSEVTAERKANKNFSLCDTFK